MIEFVEAPLHDRLSLCAAARRAGDRAAIMRKAFEDTMNDPEFQAEMEKQSLEFTPKDGKSIEELIGQL